MIKQLTLTNYRSHRNTTLRFDRGLTALRGKSEAGKTTLFEAIGYALAGSTALAEPLSDVVTYNCPESSLKVELVAEFDGVEYTVTRGKSGAEIKYGQDIVSGQREVTAFMSRVMGVDFKLFAALQLASQKEVEGIIASGGHAEASNLVETLSNMSLLSDLLAAVQENLVSGNLKATQETIAKLKAEAEDVESVEKVDLVDLEAAVLVTKASEAVAETGFTAAVQAAGAASAQAEAAKGYLRANQEAVNQRETALRNQAALLQVVKPSADHLVPAETVAEWVAAQQTNAEITARRKVQDKADQVPLPAQVWEGTLASLEAEIDTTDKQVNNLRGQWSDLSAEMKTLQASVSNELTCPTCGQDRPNKEHLEAHNKAAEAKYEALADKRTGVTGELGDAQGMLTVLKDLWERTRAIRSMFTDECWSFPDESQPERPVWVGGDIPEYLPIGDVAAANRDRAAYAKAEREYELSQAKLSSLSLPEVASDEQVAEWEGAKQVYGTALEVREDAQVALAKARAEVRKASDALDAAKASESGRLSMLERLKEKVQTQNTLLEEMAENNEIIKVVKEARPQITAQLWSLVLGTTSRYFSQMREQESIIDRDAKSFTCNGHSVKGLSGSTKNLLGLALRISLSKVFTPNVSILLLDEVFAGSSPNREIAGLGYLASCGFEQVILVTHSELADTFADQVIRIEEGACLSS